MHQKYFWQAEKRAHHNALERKRRDHIKDSFSSLRDSVPALHGEKVVSHSNFFSWRTYVELWMRQAIRSLIVSGQPGADSEEGRRIYTVHEEEE